MTSKKTHGGARKGAGRKGPPGGTTVVRVPNAILAIVKKLIAEFKEASKGFPFW